MDFKTDNSKFAVIASVLAAVLLGLPVWWKTTEIYRAELPIGDTERLIANLDSKLQVKFPVSIFVDSSLIGEFEDWEVDIELANITPEFKFRQPQQTEQVDWSDEHAVEQLEIKLAQARPAKNSSLYVYVFCDSNLLKDKVLFGQLNSLFVQSRCANSASLQSTIIPVVETLITQQQNAIDDIKAKSLLFSSDEYKELEITERKAAERRMHHLWIESVMQLYDAVVAYFEFSEPDKMTPKASSGSVKKASESKLSRRPAKFAPRYQLLFSLLVADPLTSGSFDWDIQSAYEKMLEPLITSLNGYIKFDVRFQIVRHALPTVYPIPHFPKSNSNSTKATTYWTLSRESLGLFINSAEWPLHSVINTPLLNFLLYIPPLEQNPLRIVDNTGAFLPSNAFLVSQWGGVIIRNWASEGTRNVYLKSKQLEEVMAVWRDHLKQLLDLEDVFSVPMRVLKTKFAASFDVSEAPKTFAISQTDLDTWSFRKTVANLLNSIHTQSSLEKLVTSLGNMVVEDSIALNIRKSLDLALKSLEDLRIFSNLEAFTFAKTSLQLAETAFFDPTMVPLLYFPDEHRIAIYMPFFIPALVPLVIIILREIKLYSKKRKAKID